MKPTCLFLTSAVILMVSLGASKVNSMACPSICTCRWKAGKETSDCVGKRLSDLPSGLSRGTQVLDLSRNSFEELKKDAFFKAGLLNLQKVHIADCKIRKIHDNAFSHLANLVELDLENNLLIAVPSETFVDYPELRRLNLNSNHIRRIESNAFVKLPFLAILEMSNCFLEYVGSKAFYGLNQLQLLKLNGNRLATLPADVGLPISTLHSIYLFDNPWRCDCDLRLLRNWLFNNELPASTHPTCTEPSRLEGLALVDIKAEDFACEPVVSSPWAQFDAYRGEQATLVCNVQADPPVAIQWSHDGYLLSNETRSGFTWKRTYTVTEEGRTNRFSWLRIDGVAHDDAGEYICIAENIAGQVIVNITLLVTERSVKASSLSNGHIAGISIGLVLISLATTVVVFILLAKMRHQQSDEEKHLTVEKKQNLHLVNHVKFDVTKEKLEVITDNNSVHKPLCSIVNSNFSTSTVLQDKMHLEDSIGGNRFLSSASVGVINNKPDVVNIVRIVSSPEELDDDDDDLNREITTNRPAQQYSSKKSGKSSSPLKEKKLSLVGLNDIHSKSKYFMPTMRSESQERLCDFLQLYDEAASDSPRRKQQDRELEQCDNSARQNEPYRNKDIPKCTSVDKHVTLTDPKLFITIPGQDDSGQSDNKKSPGWTKKDSASTAGAVQVPAIKTGSKTHGTVKRYAAPALGNALGILSKHANLHGQNYVPVLPPLLAHHFAQARDSPDEGYEDEVEEEVDM